MESDEAFTTEQVVRITNVSKRRLAYWLDKGIINADIDEARGRGHVRLWSFQNLMEVRVTVWLRDRVSLQLIGRIVEKLRARGRHAPLATVRFAVVAGRTPRHRDDVIIQDEDGTWEDVAGQIVFQGVLPLDTFSLELANAAKRDRESRRTPGRVERRRGRLGSAAVFAGTRVPVDAIKRLHAAGWTTDRILANYPGLTRADVTAAIRRAG